VILAAFLPYRAIFSRYGDSEERKEGSAVPWLKIISKSLKKKINEMTDYR
jgi:hypothetical protein